MPVCFNEDEYSEFLRTGEGSFVRKKVLIEGDSWVSHPQVLNLSWIMDYDSNGEYGILNVASPGATAHEMFHRGSPQLRRLHRVIKTLRHGFSFDLIFLSAGGNDIVGPEIKNFLLDKNDHPDKYGIDLIIDERLNDAIEHIAEDYRKILSVIANSSANRNTPVVTHTYSYIIPRKVGTHFGPFMFNQGWVAYHMEKYRGIFDQEEQIDIITEMLTRFHNALVSLEYEFDRFLAVDTLATLVKNGRPDVSLFHDEIHPNMKGFKKVFRRIKSVARRYDMWAE